MRVVLDSQLRVLKSDLPRGAADMVREALTIPNEQKETAVREGVFDAESLPDFFYLWEETGHELVLPRGFLHQFAAGMRSFNKALQIDDHTSLGSPISPSVRDKLKAIKMRDHQPDAVKAITDHRQGIYQAPPGSGKTVTVLEAWQQIGVRGLIIVDKTNIAEQWRERAQTFLGYKPGLVGDGVWEEGDLTIALLQTLWSRHQQLDADAWWDRFGFACLDECHHIPANTFGAIMLRLPARWRIGASATPERKKGQMRYASAILGPVFHQTTREQLRGSGVLIKPKVKVVRTDFDFPYQSTIRYGRKVVKRNNYAAMMTALTGDGDRNHLIGRTIASEPMCHHLVISRHLKHLDILEQLAHHYLSSGGHAVETFMLTGARSREERMDIAHKVMAANACVVFSTIADEALDVPILDRVHLTFPTRQPAKITQQIGRIERAHKGKKDALVYDYFDHHVGVLKSQFRERRREVYAKQGYELLPDPSASRLRPGEARTSR